MTFEMDTVSSKTDDNAVKEGKTTPESTKTTLSVKPKNVSPRVWEKFQILKQKREAIAQRNADRRQKQLKKLTSEEQESNPEEKQKEKYEDNAQCEPSTSSAEKTWEEVRGFMHCNDHLKSVDKGRYAEKSKLEEKIEEAMQKGDIDAAEKISDQIATNEFGRVVVEAIDAKNYTEKRKLEDDSKKAKKKKKLNWGFSHKERWESKCNM